MEQPMRPIATRFTAALASVALAALVATLGSAAAAAPAPIPTPLPELTRDQLRLGGDYDPAIPTQQQLLGFASGDRVATPAEITQAFQAWDAASPKAQL